jgi:hypothetical protein
MFNSRQGARPRKRQSRAARTRAPSPARGE